MSRRMHPGGQRNVSMVDTEGVVAPSEDAALLKTLDPVAGVPSWSVSNILHDLGDCWMRIGLR